MPVTQDSGLSSGADAENDHGEHREHGENKKWKIKEPAMPACSTQSKIYCDIVAANQLISISVFSVVIFLFKPSVLPEPDR